MNRHDQLIGYCNTEERIEQCCKQNTSFKPENFNPKHDDYIENLIAVKRGEALFSREKSQYQCRGDIIDHNMCTQYARQAKEGIKDKSGKRQFGIRVPLRLIPRPSMNGTHLFDGIAGWHREEASRQAGLSYFPAILDQDFLDLETKYEKDRYLRRLNKHADNGLPNSESDLLNGIAAALLPSSGILQDEVTEITTINRKIQDQNLPDSDLRKLRKKRKELITKVVERLVDDVVEDSAGRWTKAYAEKKIKNVIDNWDHSENIAIYVYSKDEMDRIIEREKKRAKNPKKMILKAQNGNANGVRQLKGDLWSAIINYDETYGKLPEEVTVVLALKDAGRVKKLHEERLKHDKTLKRHIEHAYKDKIKVNTLFLGQSKSPGQFEQTAKLYNVTHVKTKLDQINKKIVDNSLSS